MFLSINYLFGGCILKIVVLMVNTIWTKENGLSYLMRFWLVMEPRSLYFKVVFAVFYLKRLLVRSIILLAIFYISLFG